MKKVIFFIAILLLCFSVQAKKKKKQLYSLPDQSATSVNKDNDTSIPLSDRTFLVGGSGGLYRVTSENQAFPLWSEGSVEQILGVEVTEGKSESENGNSVGGGIVDDEGRGGANVGQSGGGSENGGERKIVFYFRTSLGVLYSEDLMTFSLKNNGLPFLTIKEYDGVNTTFKQVIHSLKDIGVSPYNSKEIVTATKDCVYYSEDGGENWKSLGSMSRSTPGVKAVAICDIESEKVVFMSHPIFGLSYMVLNGAKVWKDVGKGFDFMQTMTQTDEIADILPIKTQGEDGKQITQIYISQTYIPRIYRFLWEEKRAECIYRGEEPCETIDGLSVIDGCLLYTKIETLGSLNLSTLQSPGIPEKLSSWKESFSSVDGGANAAWVPKTRSGFSDNVCLNELWLLYPGTINTQYAKKANNIKCVYASAYQCRLQEGIDKFKKIIKDNNLNGIVIDMKDDYGLLRYQTNDDFVSQKAKVTQYKVDLDHFVEEFKKDNIYLVARIVVFKDRNLASFDNSKYSVWDYKRSSPWVGIKSYEDVTDEGGNVTGKEAVFYDEKWVDPYCPYVWEYNVAIAQELVRRGFDEIQFDYIRFPTDGLNLSNTSYRWKSEGMDKEAALVSFLSYARAHIDAPIGIDIYGANGWYRSGTRTGQDVEMMSAFVDVIGPMFYPSHFEQSFLDCAPFSDRTYRIYYYGTYRNTIMARNRVIVRPWAQAFYLNVRYDRQYYGPEYVIKQVFGVRDSVNRGYMYWNNSGDYSNISPDVDTNATFIGTAPESDLKFRKPAIGKEVAPPHSADDMMSVMDSLYYTFQEDDYTKNSNFTPLLKVGEF